MISVVPLRKGDLSFSDCADLERLDGSAYSTAIAGSPRPFESIATGVTIVSIFTEQQAMANVRFANARRLTTGGDQRNRHTR